MQTLNYGYKQPENEDTGNVFFPAMAANIAQLNNHTHDGVTSALIPTVSQAIAHAAWVAVGGFPGLYSQVITLPTGYLYDTTRISTKDTSGNMTYNQINKASSNTYTVFTNDATQDLVAEYGS